MLNLIDLYGFMAVGYNGKLLCLPVWKGEFGFGLLRRAGFVFRKACPVLLFLGIQAIDIHLKVIPEIICYQILGKETDQLLSGMGYRAIGEAI